MTRPKENQTVAKIRSMKSRTSKLSYIVRNPKEAWRALEDILGTGENLGRISQFIATEKGKLAKGRTAADAETLAVEAARNSTGNFFNSGKSKDVKAMNVMYPYVNASIQVMRSVLQAAVDDPKAFATKFSILFGIPTASLTAWNLSDEKRAEAYKDIRTNSEYELDRNFLFIPSNPQKDENGEWIVIKIPAPSNLLSLAAPIRRSIEAGYDIEPLSVKEMAQDLIGFASPLPIPIDEKSQRKALNFLVPQQLKPPLEKVINQNLFTGGPLIPQGLENANPADQVAKKTTESAKWIAGKIGKRGMSPAVLENTLKGYLGPLATDVLGSSDNLLESLGIIEQSKGTGVFENLFKRTTRARSSETDAPPDLDPPASKDIFSALSIKEAEKAEVKLLPPLLGGTFTYEGKKIPFNQEQYTQFAKEYGEVMSKVLDKITITPGYQAADTATKEKIIKTIRNKILDAKKKEFIGKNIKDLLPFLTEPQK